MVRWIATALLALCSAAACAQAGKLPVEVLHSGEDHVGRQFVFELRDALRGSNSFSLVETVMKDPHITLSIVSTEDEGAASSALAIVFRVDGEAIPVNGLYVTSNVMVVGRDRSRDMARRILPRLDEVVTFLRTKWPAVYKSLAPTPQ